MYFKFLLTILFCGNLYSYPVLLDGSRAISYKVAESSFIGNDFFRAERIFLDLIKGNVSDEFSYQSMDKLIQIAVKLGDDRLFNKILTGFRGYKASSSVEYASLLYTMGKHLFHVKSYNMARDFLLKIEKDAPYYPKAVYIMGGIMAAKGNYKEALVVFDRLYSLKHKFKDQDLIDLSILGKARMFMLLKRYDDALAEYQSISKISSYYLSALKESVWVHFKKKEYDIALSHIEALVFVNKELYYSFSQLMFDDNNTLSDFDLIKLKSLQGYIYMEQNRFEDAVKIFNEIILHYNKVKKYFIDELKKIKFSDDLTQLISHPTSDKLPRSILLNFDYAMFGSNELYSKAFNDWLTLEEKKELSAAFNMYFATLMEAQRLQEKGRSLVLTEDELKVVAMRNVLKNYLKQYMDFTIKIVNARLDDLGLKAQLGSIDIIWKSKENNSQKVQKIQEQKQDLMKEVDKKYKDLIE